MPVAPNFAGRVYAVGGYWTGSMGEGLMIGFDALGVPTVGSAYADLLGGLFNQTLVQSGAKVDIGLEQLFHVDGRPREAFVPRMAVRAAERSSREDPALDLIRSHGL